MLGTASVFPASVTSVNLDTKTVAAMAGIYAGHVESERLITEKLADILEHYKKATVSSSGIFASKWLDRRAMANVGTFSSQENYYYKRIYRLVGTLIMPKLYDVARHMLQRPDLAVYWLPYLITVSDEVRQLCGIFETVVCDGKVTFQDIAFLCVNEGLRKVFDLVQFKGIDWSSYLNQLGRFPKGMTKEELMDDLKSITDMGNRIATSGVSGIYASDVMHIENIIKDKVEDFKALYSAFSNFELDFKTGGNNGMAQVLLGVTGIGEKAVERLFDHSQYNPEQYASDYLSGVSDMYYTQPWNICYDDVDGNKVVEYSSIFDSQYDDSDFFESNLQLTMQTIVSRLRREKGRDVPCHIEQGARHYYQSLSASQIRGTSIVEFEVTCSESVNYGESDFIIKVNPRHTHGAPLQDCCREYAMSSSVDENYEDMQQLMDSIDYYTDELAAAERQIKSIENQMQSLLSEIQYSDAAFEQYQALSDRVIFLREYVNEIKSVLSDFESVRAEMIDAYSDGQEREDRIPPVMANLAKALDLTWTDAGRWEGDVFVRHAKTASGGIELTFRAELTFLSKEVRRLGIRTHRSRLGVHWSLTGGQSSTFVADVLELDKDKTAEENAAIVETRRRELSMDFPECVVDYSRATSDNVAVAGDDEALHLLWISDRLALAQNIDARLVRIYATLLNYERFILSRTNLFKLMASRLFSLEPSRRSTTIQACLTDWKVMASGAHHHVKRMKRPEISPTKEKQNE